MATRPAKPRKSSIEDSFGRKLVLLYNLYTGPFFEKIGRDEGINLTEWLVIATLARHSGIGASQVSHLTGLHKTTVSRVLSQLREKGCVEQLVDPQDARGKILSLTKTGEKIFSRKEEWTHSWSALLTSELSAAEKRLLASMLDRIIESSRKRVA